MREVEILKKKQLKCYLYTRVSTSNLLPVDNDHADRRNHYYEKFGFVITDSNICLDL